MNTTTTQEIEMPKDQSREDAIRNFVAHQSRSWAALSAGHDELQKCYMAFYRDVATKIAAIRKLESALIEMHESIKAVDRAALEAFAPTTVASETIVAPSVDLNSAD